MKSVLSFFRFWHISKYYRFLMSVLSFSKPQLNFEKIKMSRILLSINLDFGCSSYDRYNRKIMDIGKDGDKDRDTKRSSDFD